MSYDEFVSVDIGYLIMKKGDQASASQYKVNRISVHHG